MSSSGGQNFNNTYPFSSMSALAPKIRLVFVRPPENPGQYLSLNMLEYELATVPKYATISYTWGRPAPEFPESWDDAKSTLPVLLNGSEFRVQHNLHCLLQQLAYDDQFQKIPYWIDAVCINQNDLAEKSLVVPSMTKIYKGGHRNIVWLGPHGANGSTRLAFAKMESLIKLLGGRSDALMNPLIEYDDLDAYAKIVRAEFPDDEGTRSWDAIQSVWARSW